VRSLADRTVDLLVIGGGIIGAGIARDAALRGLTVALVEQHDFGSGTTSRPTRLIHGGLRYLEQFDFGLVRSDMREREVLLRVAPHLVFPLAFLLPLYRPSLVYQLKLRFGMLLYDWLSLDKSLPKRRYLGRAETLTLEPALKADGLVGAWRFYDAQVPYVERLVVENVLDAAEHGALVLNHAAAVSYLRDGDRVIGATVRDDATRADIQIRARYTVNATGPWLDATIAPLRRSARALLRLTKGIHLVTPRATEHAHVLFAESDGRLFFVVPWGTDASIVGTTDTDYRGDPGAAAATESDVRYLQQAARRAFPTAPVEKILFTWAGVRALVREEGVSEGQVSRKHKLFDHERENVRGVLSVVGGKITAYRAIAEEVADTVVDKLSHGAKGRTAETPLPGATPSTFSGNVDAETTAHLRAVYGGLSRNILDIARTDPALTQTICPQQPGIAAELAYAVRAEWACTLGDVLLRRTMFGLRACQGLDCIDSIADRVGAELGWDTDRKTAEIAAYRAEVAPMRLFSVT